LEPRSRSGSKIGNHVTLTRIPNSFFGGNIRHMLMVVFERALFEEAILGGAVEMQAL